MQTKFQLILTSTFWNFHENALESVLGRKSHFMATFDSNFKILKTFRSLFVKSASECYFWLANKVSTYSNEYFLKFSWKVFRISFRLKKSLLGHFWFKLWNIDILFDSHTPTFGEILKIDFHRFTVNEDKLEKQSIRRFLLRTPGMRSLSKFEND